MKSIVSGSYWYGLFLSKGLGPVALNKIFHRNSLTGKSVQDVFRMNEADLIQEYRLTAAQSSEIQNIDLDEVEKEYLRLLDQDISILTLGDESYPAILRKRLEQNAPGLLFCRGNARLLGLRSVAIAGSRRANEEICNVASRIAYALSREGVNVVSGYAKGIDTCAHLGALHSDGTTTIVLSEGITQFRWKPDFKPYQNASNYIAISQFKPYETWAARNAMARNKIISALSEAVLIIEAGLTGGSLDEGRTALKQQVPLFVIEPSTRGISDCGNQILIDEGGTPVNQENAVPKMLDAIQRTEQFEPNTSSKGQGMLF